jgi:ketosteroid isomerase-like protein
LRINDRTAVLDCVSVAGKKLEVQVGQTLEIVNRYLNAWNHQKGAGLRELVTADVSYTGPLEQVVGVEAMIAMAAKYTPLHGGMKMLRQFEDGDHVCSIYELLVVTPDWTLSIPTADWIRVVDGRVAEQRVFQDVREVERRFSGGAASNRAP